MTNVKSSWHHEPWLSTRGNKSKHKQWQKHAKANKVGLHFEKTTGAFLGHPVMKLLSLSQLAPKGLGEGLFYGVDSQSWQCFIFFPRLCFLVISFDLTFFLIDNSWPRFFNPLSTITCIMTRQWFWIDIGCVFKWHPSYLDELQQLFLKSVARFNPMPGITPMVLASQLGLVPNWEWWL